jgi:hypothetical protein
MSLSFLGSGGKWKWGVLEYRKIPLSENRFPAGFPMDLRSMDDPLDIHWTSIGYRSGRVLFKLLLPFVSPQQDLVLLRARQFLHVIVEKFLRHGIQVRLSEFRMVVDLVQRLDPFPHDFFGGGDGLAATIPIMALPMAFFKFVLTGELLFTTLVVIVVKLIKTYERPILTNHFLSDGRRKGAG